MYVSRNHAIFNLFAFFFARITSQISFSPTVGKCEMLAAVSSRLAFANKQKGP
jgi:hypothetical protein